MNVLCKGFFRLVFDDCKKWKYPRRHNKQIFQNRKERSQLIRELWNFNFDSFCRDQVFQIELTLEDK